MKQAIQGPFEYITDPWNFFDLMSAIMNACYLIMINTCALTESTTYFSVGSVRTVGGLAAFLLWIKMFYWLRLFKSTAYFITLIFQTAKDIKPFMTLILLILFAFANFFFILNNNTPQNPVYAKTHPKADFHYVDDYLKGYDVINAIIAMWLLALGEFDLDGTYSEGDSSFIIWLAFILATFIVLIVFMNMMIAIMADSFAKVGGEKEESALNE